MEFLIYVVGADDGRVEISPSAAGGAASRRAIVLLPTATSLPTFPTARERRSSASGVAPVARFVTSLAPHFAGNAAARSLLGGEPFRLP